MKQYVCKQVYDPCYGFNVIRVGTEVCADTSGEYYLISLFNAAGHLIGTISRSEFNQKFN